MNKNKISLLAAAVIGSAATAFATDVNDVEPGTLASLLGNDVAEITSLKVSGTIDVRDLITVADLPALSELDLSEAKIVSYVPLKPLALSEGDFPDNYLPAGIFFGKGLEKLSLPATLERLGNHSLAGNKFQSLMLPVTLSSIGDYAVYDCDALTEITLPASLTSLGNYSFAGCDNLSKVDMADASSLKEISQYAFRNDAALSDLILPQNLTEIGTGAFAGCTALTAVELPSSLKTVGEQAFTLTGLSKAELPSSVKTIGDFAYAKNEALEEATFSANTTLGDGVFYYSPSLKEVNATGLEVLPDYTFTGVEALNFGDTDAFSDLKEIGDYALLQHKATKLILGPGLTYLGDGALEGMTSLEEIDAEALGDNVPELGQKVFAGIDQKAVTLTVAEFTGESWKNADQWKEFKLNELSGINNPVADPSSSIRAWFSGSELQISAPEDIENVAVFLSSGAKVFQMSPYSTTAVIDTSDFSDRMFIVEVKTESDRKVFKLIR